MNSKSKEELVEQYEDAAFALLMSEYAELEGNRLLQEFEEAKAKGEVSEVPAALDAKCRKMIRQAYEKQRRKEQMNRILRTIGRTAAVLFITLGVCTTLIFSVEALRTPVINFLMDQQEQFFAIDFDKEATGEPTKETDPMSNNENNDKSPLSAIVPEKFELSRYVVKDDGTIVVVYNDSDGHRILLTTSKLEGNLNLDTENADSEQIVVAGYEGVLINKDGEFKLTWFDIDRELAYQLGTTGLEYAEFWCLAEEIAKLNIGG